MKKRLQRRLLLVDDARSPAWYVEKLSKRITVKGLKTNARVVRYDITYHKDRRRAHKETGRHVPPVAK